MEEVPKESPEVTPKEKKQKDWLLPASIVVAALLVSVSLVYNAGKKPDTAVNQANLGAAANAPSVTNVPPVTSADHIEGNPNAPVKVIEYSDLECPSCKEFHATLNAVLSVYGDQIALVYRHFPLAQLHSKAPAEAQAAECAYKQGGNTAFFNFINQVFTVTPSNNGLDPAELPKIAGQIGLDVSQFTACQASDYGKALIQQEYNDAINAGGQGTPYSIVINSAGQKYPIDGALPIANVESIINQALKGAQS